MLKVALTSLIVMFAFFGKTETFTRVYSHWSCMDYEDNILQDWLVAKTIFVFNANNSNDIIWYYPSGDSDVFTGFGNVQTGETESGYSWQMIKALTGDGVEISFQLFDTLEVLRIFFPTYYFEFAVL